MHRKPKGYWTKERCNEEALKYNTRKQFENGSRTVYYTSLKNKWMDDICNHMEIKRHTNGYWTYEKCKEEAIKYENKCDFKQFSGSGYAIAYKNNWLDEICFHMIKVGSKYERCIYAYEFSDNNVYIGLTYDLEKRHNQRQKCSRDSVTIHIKKTGLEPIRKQLTEYINKDDAATKEGDYVDSYIKNGWKILNKHKTGGLGGTDIKWTFDKCKEEALKFKNKKEFCDKSFGAYNKAKSKKWINDICSHMTPLRKPKVNWDFYLCYNESIKYKSRTEFNKKSCGAYKYALKNNLLDMVCIHMKKNIK